MVSLFRVPSSSVVSTAKAFNRLCLSERTKEFESETKTILGGVRAPAEVGGSERTRRTSETAPATPSHHHRTTPHLHDAQFPADDGPSARPSTGALMRHHAPCPIDGWWRRQPSVFSTNLCSESDLSLLTRGSMAGGCSMALVVWTSWASGLLIKRACPVPLSRLCSVLYPLNNNLCFISSFSVFGRPFLVTNSKLPHSFRKPNQSLCRARSQTQLSPSL